MVLCIYNCIYFRKNPDVPTNLIEYLKEDGFLLKDEVDTIYFLGVNIRQKTMTPSTWYINILFNLSFRNLGFNGTPKINNTPAQEFFV